MPTTITGLPDASLPLSGSERIPMDQNGVTVDVSVSQLLGNGIIRSVTTGLAGASLVTKIVAMVDSDAYNNRAILVDDATTLFIVP